MKEQFYPSHRIWEYWKNSAGMSRSAEQGWLLVKTNNKQEPGCCGSWLHTLFSFSLKETHQTLHTWSLSLLIAFLVLHVHKNNFCLGFIYYYFFKCRNFKKRLGLILLTRLRRRLIAYSWVQTHSHGSKPPSAILSRPVRPWRTTTTKNKAECSRTLCGTNRTLPVVAAPLVFHRYKQSRGRRQIKLSQQTPWMHSNG